MSSTPPWVIRNPSCASHEVEAAVRLLDPSEVFEPVDRKDWQEIEMRLAEDSPDWIVAIGGDGTVQSVVRLIGAGSEIALGIVPAGTGNDFARALDLPLDPEEVAGRLAGGKNRRVDLLAVTLDDGDEALVVNAVTVGLSGLVHSALTEEMKERWGRFAYLRAAVAAASELKPFEVELVQRSAGDDADDEASTWTGRLLHISIANGSTAGGGVLIAPNAEVDDGRIDVCAVAEAPWSQITTGLPEVLKGSEPAESPWLLSSPEQVDLDLRRPRQVSIDGEPSRAGRIRARILPGALRVRMPEREAGVLTSLLGMDHSPDA